MRFAELPTIGVLCDLALAGVLVALLARPGSPQMQVPQMQVPQMQMPQMQMIEHDAGQVETPRATSPCLTIGNVEFIGERTIVTLPEPLGDDKCHSHVREYRGEVGPANLVREYDRF